MRTLACVLACWWIGAATVHAQLKHESAPEELEAPVVESAADGTSSNTVEAEEARGAMAGGFVGHVDRVYDGDSFRVQTWYGTENVDLLNIDAPELYSEPEFCQPYAAFARDQLAEWIEGEVVRVEFWYRYDGRRPHVIGYARLERTDQNIGDWLVEHGCAWVYGQRERGIHLPTDRLLEAEEFAREQHLGLWADEEPIEPLKWREVMRIARRNLH